MDKSGVLILGALVAVGGFLYINAKKTAEAQANEVIVPAYDMSYDPRYLEGNSGIPTEIVSTDDFGGTLRVVEHNIGAGPYHVPRNTRESRSRVEADYPTFTGGTFLHPDLLPPTRTYKIQGGRFVNPGILPPEREVTIQQLGLMRRGEG